MISSKTCEIRTVIAIGMLLLPGTVFADEIQFTGRLFFSSQERLALQRKELLPETVSDFQLSAKHNRASRQPVRKAERTLLSFDGILGNTQRPQIWINQRPWVNTNDIKGIVDLLWITDREQLQVNLRNRRKVFLSIGQCLSVEFEDITCESLPVDR